MRKLAVVLLWSVWLGCMAEDPGDSQENPGPDDVSQVCRAAEMPTCCLQCSDMLAQPVCTNGTWSCPEGSTDKRQCPSSPNQLACSPPAFTSQEMYTYPGCANEDYHCPRMKTVYCALDTLRAEHNACEQDSDCVAADVDGRCTGYGECPPAMVNRSVREDFEAKATAEVNRYCGETFTCASIGGCAYPGFVPRCQQGRCVAEPVSPQG